MIPTLAESGDQINPEPSVEDYLAYIQTRVEATNWALRGLPAERILLHVCWGSWHGLHTTDIPFEHIIASTDCGLGGRVHPQIAFAKLQALSEGATLATQRLWTRADVLVEAASLAR